MHRRSFLQTAATALAATPFLPGALSARPHPRSRFHKAVKYGMIEEALSVLDKFKLLKDLGFDGVELDSPSDLDRAEVLAARDAAGLMIPGVVDSVHWQSPLSHPDAAVRAQGVDGLKTALDDAQAYGATTVLLVPAVVNKEVTYADAYARSQEEIHKVLPLAASLGVKIAIENVWNHFLLSPLEMAHYLDAFESPWIGAYFDVGNIVNYGWPEHWIHALGPRILKLDIKEYSRQKRNDEGLWKGFQVELGEGDCDWPAVVAALEAIGYQGWATAEIPGGDRNRLQDIAARMDRILA